MHIVLYLLGGHMTMLKIARNVGFSSYTKTS